MAIERLSEMKTTRRSFNNRAILLIALLLPTMKRGFTLRVVGKGGNVFYFLDGKEIKHLQRTYSPAATLVGLINGGGEASRFDNLEGRVPENR